MLMLGAIGQYFFGFVIFLSSLFLVLLVLVQRGRGGGLAGALGGAGGQSAFGAKAGDVFTKITIGVAAVWIVMCAASVFMLRESTFDTGVNTSADSIVGGIGDADTEADSSSGLGSSGTDSSPDVGTDLLESDPSPAASEGTSGQADKDGDTDTEGDTGTEGEAGTEAEAGEGAGDEPAEAGDTGTSEQN